MNQPSARDAADEALIQSKGKTAPRVTPADIAANIASEHYFTALDGVFSQGGTGTLHHELGHDAQKQALGVLTFCVLVLRNGFTVTGESACASPDNFDAEIGRKIARDNAVQKVWPLMGYELKQQLSQRKAYGPWLSIESAPRDGSTILIRFGQDGVSQAKYNAGCWLFIDRGSDNVSWLLNSAIDGPGGPSHWQPIHGSEG